MRKLGVIYFFSFSTSYHIIYIDKTFHLIVIIFILYYFMILNTRLITHLPRYRYFHTLSYYAKNEKRSKKLLYKVWLNVSSSFLFIIWWWWQYWTQIFLLFYFYYTYDNFIPYIYVWIYKMSLSSTPWLISLRGGAKFLYANMFLMFRAYCYRQLHLQGQCLFLKL